MSYSKMNQYLESKDPRRKRDNQGNFIDSLEKKDIFVPFKCKVRAGNSGQGCSFENRSFEFSSKTGQRIDWGPPGFTFSTFYCFPNLT